MCLLSNLSLLPKNLFLNLLTHPNVCVCCRCVSASVASRTPAQKRVGDGRRRVHRLTRRHRARVESPRLSRHCARQTRLLFVGTHTTHSPLLLLTSFIVCRCAISTPLCTNQTLRLCAATFVQPISSLMF